MVEEKHSAIAETVASLSREPYDSKLAENVWQRLVIVGDLFRKHRDYCGIGFIYHKETNLATIVNVHDAHPICNLLELRGKEQFIRFLAEQSDFTMAGTSEGPPELLASSLFYVNNQRITREFLLSTIDHERGKDP